MAAPSLAYNVVEPTWCFLLLFGGGGGGGGVIEEFNGSPTELTLLSVGGQVLF